MNNNITQEQINCIVQCGKQVAIFDADNLLYTEAEEQSQSNPQPSNQSPEKITQPLKEEQQPNKQKEQQNLKVVQGQETKVDPKLLQKLTLQMKHTQENFFNVVKFNEPEKKNKRLVKSLLSIEQVAEHTANSILKQGYMEKKTDAIIFKWKRRYFTLTPEKLFFFENDKKEKVIGCVNIKIIAMTVSLAEDEIVLDFNGQCQNIHLKCQKKQQTEQWKEWLEQVSKFQSKEKKMLLKTMNKPFYSQQDTITERDFIHQAETGDILLFYTRHIGAKIQRVITGSDFDHVAMVVKFRSSQVMVFEANQMSGVALYEWNQYVRAFNLYDKITYRKLVSPRKSQIQHNLLKFIRGNLGRKYQLNISKLFTFQSDFNWKLVDEDSTRGYFCSQLIAKAFKSIGLLDPKKSSCRYWPVDFSEKQSLKLNNGVFLGPEQAIVLHKHVKQIV